MNVDGGRLIRLGRNDHSGELSNNLDTTMVPTAYTSTTGSANDDDDENDTDRRPFDQHSICDMFGF